MSFDSVFNGAPTSNDGQAVPSGIATLGIDISVGQLYYKTPSKAGWQEVAGGGGSGQFVELNPTADQIISGAHSLILSDPASTLWEKNALGIGPSGTPTGDAGDDAPPGPNLYSYLNVGDNAYAPTFSDGAGHNLFITSFGGLANPTLSAGSKFSLFGIYSVVGDDPSNATNWYGSGNPLNDAIVGGNFQANNNGSSGNWAIGSFNLAYSNGSGIGDLIGSYAQVANFGSGTVPLAQAFTDSDGESSGPITEYDAVNIVPQTGGGIVHYVGLNIGNVTGSGTSDSFAIKVAGGPSDLGPQLTTVGSLFAGPSESLLDPDIQGFWSAPETFTALNPASYGGIGMEIQGNGTQAVNGLGIVTLVEDGPVNGISHENGVTGIESYVFTKGSTNITGALIPLASWLDLHNSGTTDEAYFFLGNFTGPNAGPITDLYGLWLPDLGVMTVTNPYYSWLNSRGVYRIKEDKTHNSVGQAIPAQYNPQFTKYTPGAVDFERITQYWDTNIATFGAEAGGTGTLRKLQLIGAGLLTNATLLPTSDPGVSGQLWNNAGVVSVSP